MKDKKVIILDYDGTLYNGSVLGGWGKYVEEFLNGYIGKTKAKEFIKRNGFKDFNIVGQKLAFALIKDFGTARDFYEHQDKNNYALKASDLEYVNPEKIKRLKKYAKIYIVSNSPVSHVVNSSKANGFDISYVDGILQTSLVSVMLQSVTYSNKFKRKKKPNQKTFLLLATALKTT